MKCAWKELLAILPRRFCDEVDKFGREAAIELRLRLDKPPELITLGAVRWLNGVVSEEELRFVVNAASRYSPWAATTAAKGYITCQGGHRIGLCGEVYGSGGQILGVRNVTSLNIRIARDHTGLAPNKLRGNILIIGPPGSGKTTYLRDLCRVIAGHHTVTVVDERGELFPKGFLQGKRMDVLSGCAKADGILMALRTMGPDYIAVDEITQQEDSAALENAWGCGVQLLATAHAADGADLLKRPIYRKLMDLGVFSRLVILNRDKSSRIETLEAPV